MILSSRYYNCYCFRYICKEDSLGLEDVERDVWGFYRGKVNESW